MELQIEQNGFNLIQTFSIVIPSNGMISVDINDIPKGPSIPGVDYVGLDFIFNIDTSNGASYIQVNSNSKEGTKNPNRSVVTLNNFNYTPEATSSEPIKIATIEGNSNRKIFIHFFVKTIIQQKILTCSVFWKDE